MLGGTSPGQFPDSSRSPPLRAFDNLLMKPVSNVSARRYSPASGNPQRLIIRSPTQRGISTSPSPADMELTTMQTSQIKPEKNGLPWVPHYFQPASPTSPPTPKTSRSDSPDPLSIFATSSPRTPRSSLNTLAPPFEPSQTPSRADENVDELLLFSPAKRLSPNIKSSPMTPSSPNPASQVSVRSNLRSSSPLQHLTPSPPHEYPPSPLPAPLVPPPYQPPPEVVRAAHEEENAGRYSLRGRKPIQVRPFTGENAQYQAAMRSIPEAIVKQRNFDGRGHRHNPEDHYENDETQKDGYVLEDDEAEWEERQKRRRREHEERYGTNGGPDRPSEQEEPSYPPILQDIPSTDEEDGIVGGLTKEDRKFLRARKRQKKKEKEKEKADGHRRQDETSSRRKKSPRRQISSFPIPSQIQPPTASRVSRRSREDNDSGVNLISS